MKNLSIVMLVLLALSCQQQNSDQAMESSYEVQDSEPSMYAVSYEEAKKNITYYDTMAYKFLKTDPIKAFTIRSVDLIEAIGLPPSADAKSKYKHVRIYLGLDSATNQFKVYMTPVEGAKLSAGKAGKDVILDGPYEGIPDSNGDVSESDGQYMMDFSAPCPKTCPQGGE
ncbi:hypothetical protein [Ekhidna sp.]|uniref:hypothetical protein n=1 Tax=Ekhidna sp. TaxID=2608089 RepID=UPI0035195B94